MFYIGLVLGIPCQLIDLQLTNILLLITPYKNILDFDWLIDSVFFIYFEWILFNFTTTGVFSGFHFFKLCALVFSKMFFPLMSLNQPKSFRLFPLFRSTKCNMFFRWHNKIKEPPSTFMTYPPALAQYLVSYIYRKQPCSLNV